MTFKELRTASGMTQQAFSDFFGIPKRTIEDWDSGKSNCKQYLIDLMAYRIDHRDVNFDRSYFTFKDIRVASGMTQKDFAAYFGFNHGTVKNWESNGSCGDYVLGLIEFKLLTEKYIK